MKAIIPDEMKLRYIGITMKLCENAVNQWCEQNNIALPAAFEFTMKEAEMQEDVDAILSDATSWRFSQLVKGGL